MRHSAWRSGSGLFRPLLWGSRGGFKGPDNFTASRTYEIDTI
jgi:hypothetical protein